jgi:hypothetical protein
LIQSIKEIAGYLKPQGTMSTRSDYPFVEGNNTMLTKIVRRFAGTVLLATFAAACGDQGPEATGDVEITMQKTDVLIAQLVADWSASIVNGDASMVPIDPDDVESLIISVSSIQFLPQGGDEAEDGSWRTLPLSDPVELDLMDLPTESEPPYVLTSAEIEAGTYVNVRLFTEDASIRFKVDVSVGIVFDFAAGMDHQVEIPSNDQTGIKTDATLTVEAGDNDDLNTVNLLFSTGSTFQNVSATGNGWVMLTPVINQSGDGGA